MTIRTPVLREKALPVEIINEEIRELVENMIETMYAEGGAGLAAPQVGVSKRIIIVDTEERGPIVLINPVIIRKSGESKEEEGCLSVPNREEDILRYKKIKVRYQDIDGNWKNGRYSDLNAVSIQHELDHLDGILFIDRLK